MFLLTTICFYSDSVIFLQHIPPHLRQHFKNKQGFVSITFLIRDSERTPRCFRETPAPLCDEELLFTVISGVPSGFISPDVEQFDFFAGPWGFS